MQREVGIVGRGIVGDILYKTFEALAPVCYDKHKLEYLPNKDAVSNTKVCFVAVPTPKLPDGSCDISIIEEVVSWLDAKIICIKSTIPPTTTDSLIWKYQKKICFSPEFAGSTQHVLKDENFVILGGDRRVTDPVAQLYQKVKNANFVIRTTNAKTAELVKYTENFGLAIKIIFANEVYRIAGIFGISYTELRELWLLDPRFNRSHTFVYEDKPYYDSKCFNKDLPALWRACKDIGYDAKLLESVMKRNEEFKEQVVK